MSLADQFAADAAAGGAAPQPAMTLAQQFAADAAAGAKLPASAPASGTPTSTVPQSGLANDLAAGGMSPDTLAQLGQIGGAAAHGVGSMFNNAANAVEKGVAAGANMIPGVQGSTFGNWLANTANSDVAAQSAADRQFSATASPGERATAFLAPALIPMGGAMGGARALGSGVTSGLRMLPGMGAGIGSSVAGALGTGAGNAALGAAFGAATPVDSSQPYGPQLARNMGLGALVSAAAPAMLAAARATANGIRNVAQPIFQPAQYVGQSVAAGLTPQDAATAAANIRNAPQYVPGSMPTTAQVAGLPYFVQTEKALSNLSQPFKEALTNQQFDANNARWQALNQVAGTPLDLANAQAARDTAANPLYNVAKQQNIPVDAPMTDLLSRPAMQGAVKRAQVLADNTNAGPIFQSMPVPNMLNGAPLTATTLTGGGAQAIKEALDAMLLPENTQRLSGKEIGALNDTRQAYIAWLEGHSPEFTQARQTYASMSPPINTMTAAQQMQAQLGSTGRAMDTNNNPFITAPGYATALKRALGQQDFGIDPNAQQTLENIGRDLQRATISNSIRSPGSDTAYNLAANGWLARKLYGPNFQGSGAGGILGAAATGAGAAGGAALFGPAGAGVGSALGSGIGSLLNGSRVGARLNQTLGGYLLDPVSILPFLDSRANVNGLPVNGFHNAMNQGLLRYGAPVALRGLLGGIQQAN